MKRSSKPIYVTLKIFDSNSVAIHEIKTTVTLNKLACVRMDILEWTEVPMYEFIYDYLKKTTTNKQKTKKKKKARNPDYNLHIVNVWNWKCLGRF